MKYLIQFEDHEKNRTKFNLMEGDNLPSIGDCLWVTPTDDMANNIMLYKVIGRRWENRWDYFHQCGITLIIEEYKE